MASSPMVSLASSVHAGPSTFALLVGSGISSGAGVPSGWEMTVDLIRRLAALHDQDAGDDPASWYRERLDGEPDYSEVLEELAPSRGDRRNLLSAYFEPTQQERDEGLKIPTRAHRAIAGLVADGFVKVIVRWVALAAGRRGRRVAHGVTARCQWLPGRGHLRHRRSGQGSGSRHRLT